MRRNIFRIEETDDEEVFILFYTMDDDVCDFDVILYIPVVYSIQIDIIGLPRYRVYFPKILRKKM